MKAGASAHQILARWSSPVLAWRWRCLPSTNWSWSVERTVTAWSNADYEPIPPDSGILSNVWIRDGDDMVRAQIVTGRGAQTRLRGVTIYQRDRGALARVIDVDRADQVPGGWRLENVRTYDANMNLLMRKSVQTGLVGIEPSRFTLAKVDPSERDFVALRQEIKDLKAAGRPTEEARTGWWHKISGPLSTVLMPLLAATAAFGLARSGRVLLRATIGMALGFAYFVADNFSVALGNYGAYPPFLAAWAPFLLFLLIGEFPDQAGRRCASFRGNRAHHPPPRRGVNRASVMSLRAGRTVSQFFVRYRWAQSYAALGRSTPFQLLTASRVTSGESPRWFDRE